MNSSRTYNTIKNVKTGIIVQIINKLMSFLIRTVFIAILNTEYLGINGLFTNILTILSFTELGIGTAIIFNMYKPVAENDKEKIKSLMKLYKKSYNIIGIIVFVLGICIIPFIKYIITDIPNIKENIIIIYLLFLINTATSYFFTYKKSIISAYQQESIINKIDSIFYLIKSVMEIVFLLLTRNYIVYLIIQILATLLENIIIARKANKMFPYLKEKKVNSLKKAETKTIFSNVKALVIYKLGTSILNGTDNILISWLINVSTVGLCSNYTLIIESIRSMILTAFNGVTASIGNLNAVGNSENKEKVFYQLTFICFWIYGFISIAFIVLLNPFIELWLGSNYVLPYLISISLALNFFVGGLRTPAYTYRVTLGLFEKGKSTPFIASIINILMSIALGKIIGVSGIFFATSIAQIFSYSWIDPYLIYKNEFKSPLKNYILKNLKYCIVFLLVGTLTFIITYSININGIIGLMAKGVVVCFIPNILFLITFYKTEEFLELKRKFLYTILKKRIH